MKIQVTPSQNRKIQENKVAKNPSFKGAAGVVAQQALNFLDTNQAWGANFVDLAFMVTPRIAVDSTRGPEAGLETARREASGTTNHSFVGAYGLGAAYLLAQPLNKKFDVKVHNTFASNNIVDILGQNWHSNAKRPNVDNTLTRFLVKTIGDVKGFNPSHKDQVGGWVNVDKNAKKDAIRKFHEVIKDAVAAEAKDGKQVKLTDDAKSYLKTIMGSSIQSENKFTLDFAKGSEKEVLSIDTFIDNVYKMSKTFMKEKVGAEFADKASLADNTFIKGLKNLNTKTSLLGLGVATAIGCSIQPFNMYLTKKKTGKSGFIGGNGEDRKPDHSAKFKLMKAGATATFAGIVLATIGSPKKILQKIQYQGFTPTLNQFKLVYGMTIMSRFAVARDKDELREATTKDTLGFLNWMVLGSFVKTGVAAAFEKHAKLGDFLRYHEAEQGKGLFKKITKSELISRSEVSFSALKELGISAVQDGKALSFKEMVNKISEVAKKAALSPTEMADELRIAKGALKKIKLLGVAQVAGYAYSGLVLGLGIPKLNIAITNHLDKKRQAKKAELSHNTVNETFLSGKNQKTAFSQVAS